MLVSLGTNQAIAGNSSVTFPYACRSVQKVLIKIDDTTGSNAYSHTITVQLGQRTIINNALGFGLLGYSSLSSGKTPSGSEVAYAIDLGSHQLLDNENLYVTVKAASANALDAVDVSALVDQPVGAMPVRYTQYSDTVFTAENVVGALCFASGQGAIDEDTGAIEIRNNVNSSSPAIISTNNWFMSETKVNDIASAFGIAQISPVPLTTTFNYTASVVNTLLVCSAMPSSQRARSQAGNIRRQAVSQVGK